METTFKEKRTSILREINHHAIFNAKKGLSWFTLKFPKRESVIYLDLIKNNSNLEIIDLFGREMIRVSIAFVEGSELQKIQQEALLSIKKTNELLIKEALHFLNENKEGRFSIDIFYRKFEGDFRTPSEKMNFLKEYFSKFHSEYHIEHSPSFERRSQLNGDTVYQVKGFFAFHLIKSQSEESKPEPYLIKTEKNQKKQNVLTDFFSKVLQLI